MKNLKRASVIVAVLVIAFMVLSLAGCGAGDFKLKGTWKIVEDTEGYLKADTIKFTDDRTDMFGGEGNLLDKYTLTEYDNEIYVLEIGSGIDGNSMGSLATYDVVIVNKNKIELWWNGLEFVLQRK